MNEKQINRTAWLCVILFITLLLEYFGVINLIN